MKKIVINGFFLTRPFSGIGTYTINLLSNISKFGTNFKYIVLLPEEINEEIKKSFPKEIKFIVVNYKKKLPLSIKKFIWEFFQLPKFCKKNNIDLLFSPYACAVLSPQKFKIIATVHDAINWTDKRYTASIKSKISAFLSLYSLRFASCLITVSENSRKEIQKVSKKLPFIHVVYNTIKKPDKINSDNISPKIKALAKGKYFFYLGGYDFRKNLEKTIKAFEIFNKKAEYSLILGGKSYLENFDLNSENISHKKIFTTGFLNEEEKAFLYQHCIGFVNFSESEGFNLPLLEAIAHKKNIAASNISVHHELFSDYPIFYANPHSLKSIVSSLENLTKNSSKNNYEKPCQKILKKYSAENQYPKLIKIISQLLALK